MLQEISRQSIKINKRDEPILSWHYNVLTVCTDKGINLFNFSYNLECMDKKVDFVVSFIPTSTSSPATTIFPHKFLRNEIENVDFTQMILDPGLWPHNELLPRENAKFVAFEWSSAAIMHNNQYLLAVLNNLGNVELYTPHRHAWTCVLDLSCVIKDLFLNDVLPKDLNSLKSLKEIKPLVDIVESSAITWGPMHNHKSCYFVTAQRNGHILFWFIQTKEKEVKVEFRGESPIKIGEVMSVLWIPISDTKFLLICSNVFGQVYAFQSHIIKDTIEITERTCLWIHKDRMIPKYLKYTIVEENIILVFNKHRHLVVQMLDQNYNIISEFVKNVNDYRITDIILTTNEFYVLTVNCKIYKINYFKSNNKLEVDLELIETKETYANFETYGISTSSNGLIWALALIDRKVMVRKSPTAVDIALLCTDLQHHSEVPILLNKKSFTDNWDCVELLRYKTMNLKILPVLDYIQLYVDSNNDLFKLKMYLILLYLYNILDKNIKNRSKNSLPECSIEVIKEKIYVLHAKQLITKLNNNSQNTQLTNIEIESYIGAKNYLDVYSKKHNTFVSEFATPNAINVCRETTICQCCDEALEGLICKNGHLNMFCSLTFTAIQSDDYLTCKGCGSIARIELYEKNPKCLFCDLYLNNFNLPILEN